MLAKAAEPCRGQTFLACLASSSVMKEKKVVRPGNTNLRRRLSTVGLLAKLACFATKVNNTSNTIKAADKNLLKQGGQLYGVFLFSKTSLF